MEMIFCFLKKANLFRVIKKVLKNVFDCVAMIINSLPKIFLIILVKSCSTFTTMLKFVINLEKINKTRILLFWDKIKIIFLFSKM